MCFLNVGIPTQYNYTVNNNGNVFVQWIRSVTGLPRPPLVYALSWGSDETQLSKGVMDNFNTAAITLGLRGVTIVVASGDDGANSLIGSTSCSCSYKPSFPATSSYVTSVGASMGSKNVVPNLGESEITCQSSQGGVITSGGGFSLFSPRPAWQTNAVTSYFKSLAVQPASGYNASGRGYPDITLLGVQYEVIVNGDIQQIYGTSASTPAFAGMISTINMLRKSKGLKSVGFINPTLYSSRARTKFNDIQSGDNRCCRYNGINPANSPCCTTGFSAAVGWDPVTGLGSIYFPRLANLFNLSLPFVKQNYTTSSSSGIKLTQIDIIMIAVFGSGALIFCVGAVYRCLSRRKQPSTIYDMSSQPREQPSFAAVSSPSSRSNTQPGNPTYATEEERIVAMQEMIMNQNSRQVMASAPPINTNKQSNDNGLDYSDPAMESLWETEFNILKDMGFTDRKKILPLLCNRMKIPVSQTPELKGVPNESRMQRVINDLVSDST